MTNLPEEGKPDVVSDELLKRLRPRQEAELRRKDLAAMTHILKGIEERQHTATALEMLELSGILDKLNLAIGNQEQVRVPHAHLLEKDCLDYLKILRSVYEHCADLSFDTKETQSAKSDRRSKTFDLFVRTLELMLTYTHPPSTRSKEKLTNLYTFKEIKEFIPPELLKRIEDALFSEEPKVRPIK